MPDEEALLLAAKVAELVFPAVRELKSSDRKLVSLPLLRLNEAELLDPLDARLLLRGRRRVLLMIIGMVK